MDASVVIGNTGALLGAAYNTAEGDEAPKCQGLDLNLPQ